MRWFLVSSLASVVACTGDTDGGTPTDKDPTVPVEECEATVAGFDPAADSLEVAVDATVTVTFSEAIPEGGNWLLNLADIKGKEVAGTATLAGDAMSATFVPDAALAYEQVYRISAAACDDSQTADFATGAEPIVTTGLEGKTYGIAQEDLTVTNPAGLNALLAVVPGGLFDVLAFQLTTYDAGNQLFTAQATVLDEYDMPFCDLMVSADADFSANPFIELGPQNLQIDLGLGNTIELEDLFVGGRIAADGTALEDASVSLLLAFETIGVGELLNLKTEPTCDEISTTDIIKGFITKPDCVPCTTSTSGNCLLIEASADEAAEIAVDLSKECPIK